MDFDELWGAKAAFAHIPFITFWSQANEHIQLCKDNLNLLLVLQKYSLCCLSPIRFILKSYERKSIIPFSGKITTPVKHWNQEMVKFPVFLSLESLGHVRFSFLFIYFFLVFESIRITTSVLDKIIWTVMTSWWCRI